MKTRFRNSLRAVGKRLWPALVHWGSGCVRLQHHPEQIGSIKAGMNQGEVLKAVGEPVDTRSCGNRAWTDLGLSPARAA